MRYFIELSKTVRKNAVESCILIGDPEDEVHPPLIRMNIDGNGCRISKAFITTTEYALKRGIVALGVTPIGLWQRAWHAVARFALRRINVAHLRPPEPRAGHSGVTDNSFTN